VSARGLDTDATSGMSGAMTLFRRLCVLLVCLSLLPWGAAVRAASGAEGLPPAIAAALSEARTATPETATPAPAPGHPDRAALPARLCFGPSLPGGACGAPILPPEAAIPDRRAACGDSRPALAEPHLPEGIFPLCPQRPPRAA
jgi:hypothetical protein